LSKRKESTYVGWAARMTGSHVVIVTLSEKVKSHVGIVPICGEDEGRTVFYKMSEWALKCTVETKKKKKHVDNEIRSSLDEDNEVGITR
jgi:hypothetical protein